ncbi:hypothetical protein OE88DRAFT_1737175 [Heliocybe sulcata]|uniref:DUF6593 domain-containing protein n=1 Tax=Heliocybe sulcata TaxID=5364 RepID=A0A5C3MVS3_9AGAM|nr:hypothetical protein OE88DRAFT_1737175 [Heliocybe sulcata]
MDGVAFVFSASLYAGHIKVVADDSQVDVYTVDRKTGVFHGQSDSVVCKKIGGRSYAVGAASVKVDEVMCNQRRIKMYKRMLSSSETFIGSDGLQYKWKVKGMCSAYLWVDGGSEHLLAVYTAESRFWSRCPAVLTVYADALGMLDEVVVTCVYIARKIQMLQDG